jgi:hypothetical protein
MKDGSRAAPHSYTYRLGIFAYFRQTPINSDFGEVPAKGNIGIAGPGPEPVAADEQLLSLDEFRISASGIRSFIFSSLRHSVLYFQQLCESRSVTRTSLGGLSCYLWNIFGRQERVDANNLRRLMQVGVDSTGHAPSGTSLGRPGSSR